MATPSALRNLLYCAKAYAFELESEAPDADEVLAHTERRLELAAIAFAESPEGIALAKKTKAAASATTTTRKKR